MTPPRLPDDADVGSTPWDLPDPAVPDPVHALEDAAVARIPGPASRLADEASGLVTRGRELLDDATSHVPGVRDLLDRVPLLDFASFLTGGGALAEVTYTFEANGDISTWRVLRLDAREGISEVYECRLDLQSADLDADPDALLGQPCAVVLSRNAPTRRIFGVVRRVEHLGTSGGQRLARVFIVPALWALSQRTDSRIFQDMTAVEIVQAVLRDAGVYPGLVELRLLQRYLPREYCVQYREADLTFVMRLLEEEGIAFFFRHEHEAEVLVLADHASAFEAVATLDGGPVSIAGAEAATAPTETLRHLDWGNELRPTGVVVRDYDFTRPGFDLTRRTPRDGQGPRGLYDYPTEAVIGGYGNGTYTADNDAAQAQVRHEAHVALAQRGAGRGSVTVLTPGFTFEPTGHDRHDLDERHLIVHVEHRGEAPEELAHATQHTGDSRDRYHNTFECAPARVQFRPRRAAPRPVISSVQTATVVGAPGEEIFTDEHGRIKVQFHWDRRGARGAHTSAWMRVMQGPWAGNGWGFQFIPRVGMEVVVHFLEGNPDRPVVGGALYNGRNRPPYALPEDRTQSGIKTSSSPGGNGSNELRFEDMAGAEEVYVHAQRDLVEEVLRCHSTRVGAVQQNVVLASQIERVGRHQDIVVGGDQLLRVQGDREAVVSGCETLRTSGGRDATVGPFEVERVEGCVVHHVTPAGQRSAGSDPRVTEAVRSAHSREGGGIAETWVVDGDRLHRVTATETVELGARVTHVAHDDRLVVSGTASTSASERIELAAHGAGAARTVALELDGIGGTAALAYGSTGIEIDRVRIELRRLHQRLLLSQGALLITDEGASEVLVAQGEADWGLRVSVDDHNATLTSQDGSSIVVAHDIKLRAKGDLVLTNDGGARITLKSSGEVEIHGTRIRFTT